MTPYAIISWFFLTGLLFLIERLPLRRAIPAGLGYGFAYFLGMFYWVWHVTPVGLLVLCLYLSLYFVVFTLVSYFWYKKPGPGFRRPAGTTTPRREVTAGVLSVIFLSSVWVSAEFIRSHAFTGFPWGLVGTFQCKWVSLIQVADCAGAFGVSFVVASANIALYELTRSVRTSRLRAAAAVLTAGVLVAACLAYGHSRLKQGYEGRIVAVSVIQGNIPQEIKWEPPYRDEILRKHVLLTSIASLYETDLVIWPETSVPGDIGTEEDLQEAVSSLAASTGKYMLVGAPRSSTREDRYFNSAFLYDHEGKVKAIYDKVHLVPFGEYIPFEEKLSFLKKIIPEMNEAGEFDSGSKLTVFSLDGLPGADSGPPRFGALICFEDIFPGLVREYMRGGAGFMVNITNDAWFLDSSEPHQHMSASVLRAVENRIWVVRAANTGVSCFINPKGEVTGAVAGDDGKQTYVSGHLTQEITVQGKGTFYSRHGDIFALICLTLAIIGTATIFLTRLPVPA